MIKIRTSLLQSLTFENKVILRGVLYNCLVQHCSQVHFDYMRYVVEKQGLMLCKRQGKWGANTEIKNNLEELNMNLKFNPKYKVNS